MIKFEITNEHDVEYLEVSGGLEEVCADLAILVNMIYNGCRRADVSEETASEFQRLITTAFLFPFSPVWKKRNVDGAFMITKKEAQP